MQVWVVQDWTDYDRQPVAGVFATALAAHAWIMTGVAVMVEKLHAPERHHTAPGRSHTDGGYDSLSTVSPASILKPFVPYTTPAHDYWRVVVLRNEAACLRRTFKTEPEADDFAAACRNLGWDNMPFSVEAFDVQ